jgi:hypothetical protein
LAAQASGAVVIAMPPAHPDTSLCKQGPVVRVPQLHLRKHQTVIITESPVCH